MEKLLKGLARQEAIAYDNSASILKSILPDNNDFTEDDATDWERRLGMVNGSASSLAVRKAAILRKMQAPGQNPAKSHYLWIQKQLQDAGFDVFVHENIPTQDPNSLYAGIQTELQYNGFQYGGRRYGSYVNHVVANRIDNESDTYFNFGDTYRAACYIGGEVLGTLASVPAEREAEFRQLIRRMMPKQNVAILFITYT
jgi:hypothetical protein